MKNFEEDINKCLTILKDGGIILYPTDTIWGLGCDATNEEAVNKIFSIKKRKESKSLITLVNNDAMLNKYVDEVPEQAWDIIDLTNKPTTIVYDKALLLAKNVIAEDGSVGIRLTKDTFCKQLIYKFRKPIVSTSANISGDSSPTSFQYISKKIISAVDYVVQHRQNETIKTTASSIIKISLSGEVKIIRE